MHSRSLALNAFPLRCLFSNARIFFSVLFILPFFLFYVKESVLGKDAGVCVG